MSLWLTHLCMIYSNMTSVIEYQFWVNKIKIFFLKSDQVLKKIGMEKCRGDKHSIKTDLPNLTDLFKRYIETFNEDTYL